MTQSDTTVSSYSKSNYSVYDDPMNKNFVYGEITIDFVNSIEFTSSDKVIADIGCGTGFVFDIRKEELLEKDAQYIGIEPAQGMLDTAIGKYQGLSQFSWHLGTFESMPLADSSVDKLTSSLALHWVPDLDASVKEMARVLKPGGSIDVLMIDRDDGASFKKPVVSAMKKHLTFPQIMKAAGLAQRVSARQLEKKFRSYFDEDYSLTIRNRREVILGSFDEHMKWWKARSEQIISDVRDKEAFMEDLRTELNGIDRGEGIPFDLSVLTLKMRGDQ